MANPIVSRTELAIGGEAMTVKGVIQKTAFLLGLSAASGLGFYFYFLNRVLSGAMGMGTIQMTALGSMLVGFGLAMFISAKPQKAQALSAPYAIIEGLFLGSASLMFYSFDPSIPTNALAATFVTAAVMLGLYSSGIIKVTDKFRSIVTSAMLAIMILYGIQLAMTFIFSSSLPFLFNGGIISIGFSIFVVLIASFSLLLNFDGVERGVAARVSNDFEWIFSIGILASLVWMYIEFMRLLSYLND